MVSVKNLVTFLAIAATSSMKVSAASIPRQTGLESTTQTSAVINSRQASTEDYDRETAWLSDEGLCRVFGKGVPTSTKLDNLRGTCNPYCQALTGTFNSACDGSALMNSDGDIDVQFPIYKSPSGDRYSFAECDCIEISPELEQLFADSLTALSAATCSVWLFSVKQVVEKGTYAIPGGKGSLKVIKYMAKVLRQMINSGKGKDEWASLVRSTCGDQGYEMSQSIEKAFDILQYAPTL
ncbi:uncharacterized protein CTRU02_203311 [Colletotrichum truncatum]|uniref:Uncharacterized protein n=1 Tax=Colletotrichum truncatum TaxID=5467 RepID=A0ACC3Z8Y5_COLTU|nr:uncharacterized protein CTRU02_15673 [Colletotrichum truncatum]KAF6780799.1 hypothetical protein CTRU02_15673 [Colletotrichum truncatum]